MKPYGDEIVSVAVQLSGLRGAVERLTLAAGRPGEASDTYLPLFEALNWAVSLDQRVQLLLRPEGQTTKLGVSWRDRIAGGRRMAAVDWVRNSVHHQWADALRLDPVGHGLYPSGDLYPGGDVLPRADHAWVWRDAEALPSRRERGRAGAGPTGRESYADYLQGRPADQTMAELLATFQLVGQILEPPRSSAAESDSSRSPRLRRQVHDL